MNYLVRFVALRVLGVLELLLLLDVLLLEAAEDLLDELRLDETEELDRLRLLDEVEELERLLELVLRETLD